MPKNKTGGCPTTSIVLVCCLLAAASQGQARQAAHVPQPPWQTARIHIKTQAKPLPDIVALLAHELHCSIVMDDAPILPPPDVDCDGTGKEVLDKVCDAYDYNWKVGKRGMILLTKRFGNPDEQPQMHLAELQQMAHDVMTALSGVTYEPRPWPYGCKILYDACTPAQIETLKSGNPVNFGELGATQQATLTQMLLNRRFAQIISSWKRYAEWLDLVPVSYVQARDAWAVDRAAGLPFVAAPSAPQSPRLDWIARRPDGTERFIRLDPSSPQMAAKQKGSKS